MSLTSHFYRVSLAVPYWNRATYGQILRSLCSGSIVEGVAVRDLKFQMIETLGVREAVLCGSGSLALEIALRACEVTRGDEVIIPTFCCSAVVPPILAIGATPVLADVGEELNLTVDTVGAVITQKTKAIIVPHLFGNPADIGAIIELARQKSIRVIDDAAQALGATIDGRPVGSFGDAACFSFYGNKILTTGEGGMVVCSDAALAERMRFLRNQAFGHPRFVHREVGFNYRLTNVQAAIGLAQAEKADEKVEKKREIARWYGEAFADCPDLELPWEAPGAKNVYWMYGIKLGDRYAQGRDAVMAQLKTKGVDTRAFFCPMHMQPVFQNAIDPRMPETRGSFPVSEDLWKRGLYLPSGLGLTPAQVEEVAARVLECRP